LFAAGVRGFQLVQVWHRVVAIGCVDEQHTRFPVVVRILHNLIEQITGTYPFPHAAILRADQFEFGIVLDSFHERIGNRHRDVEVFQFTFLGFARNEFANVGVVDLQDRHIGTAAGSALRNLTESFVVHTQEAHWPSGNAGTRMDGCTFRTQAAEREPVAPSRLLDKGGIEECVENSIGRTKQAASCPSGVPAPVNVGLFGKNSSRMSISKNVSDQA